MQKLFNVCGMTILGLLAYAHWYGWSYYDTDRLTGVPKSVRDNPGSYRSVYTRHTHYTGGK